MHTNEARTATTEVEHDDLSKLRELIAGVRFAGFTTIGPDGDLRSRPMTTQLLEPADQLWFLGAASSEVVTDIVANPKVNVMYSDPDSARWVSVTGRASVMANHTGGSLD